MANCVIAYDPCFSCVEKKCEICELDMHRKGVFQQSEGIANNATTTGKWISVDEALPEEFVSVLGHMTDAGDFPAVRECYRVGKVFFFPALRDRHPVSHWMQLPEPPKMKGGAE